MIEKPSALAYRGFQPNSAAGFLFAAGCVLLAAVIRWLLGIGFGATLYFVAFFPAVVIASLFAGFWPGMLALALSVAISASFFIPASVLTSLSSSFISNLAIYLISGFLTVWFGHLFRAAVRQLQEEQARRELVLKEVEHRARNMGALGAAIVQFSLKDNREAADLINSRMRSLQATNDLITRAPEMQPDIGSIIRQELMPYDLNRCSFQGENLRLRSDIARAVSLIVHELTTNSVKYGALSATGGRIEIAWSGDSDIVEIAWKEIGGPKPAANRTGFGTQLIEATVKGLKGSVERELRDDGLSCRIVLRV